MEKSTQYQQVQFEIGSVYSAHTPGNQHYGDYKVVDRTPFTISVLLIGVNFRVTKKNLATWDGVEVILPLGHYSTAPVLRASSLVS